MAMSVGRADGDEDVPMSDINTTPLVDVMLVLLIIFLISVPVILQSVPVKLPSVVYEATQTKPENVNLSVKGGSGRIVRGLLEPDPRDQRGTARARRQEA